MADNKNSKTVIERQYNIPLRREWLKVPRYKRAKKAIKATKEFLAKHMKSDNVKLSLGINLAIWKHGITNPPHHIKVNAKKYEDGKVVADYADTNFKILNKVKTLGSRDDKAEKKRTPAKKETKPKVEKKAEVKTEKKETKVEEKVTEKPKAEEKKSEVKKEEPKAEVKKESPKSDKKVEQPVKEESTEKSKQTISKSIEQAQE